MSKYQCKCGYVMVFQTDRLPYDLYLLPDDSVTDLGENLDKCDLSILENRDMIFYELLKRRKKVMHCPNCGRFHIETDIRSGVYESYIKDH